MRKTTRLLAMFLMLLIVVSALTGCIKSNEEKNEVRKEEAHKGAYYKGLSEEEQQEFDYNLYTIFESDDYKALSDEEKDELIEKFVASEKLKKEVQAELNKEQKRKEQIEKELEALTCKQDTTEEENQQIEALKQEKAYLETADGVRETTNNNEIFSISNPEKAITKINGIYKYGGYVYIDVEILENETIGGVEFFSTYEAFCSIGKSVDANDSYDDILDQISKTEFCHYDFKCVNKNAESHKEYFEQNKYSMYSKIQAGENRGCEFSVVESWEKEGDSEHPEFVIKQQTGDDVMYYMATYNNSSYSFHIIQKICPEFWAQLEVEQGKSA